MISTERIGYPTVERKAYIFFNPFYKPEINMCVGEFIEQENDAGESQYLFRIYFDELPEEVIKILYVPGIDISLRKKEYVRSGNKPYYVTCSTIADCRGDKKWWLNLVGLTYNDDFEFMLRTRAITQKCECYLGRTRDDKIDLIEYKKWGDYQKSLFPNLNEVPENVFHKISSV